jgi:hypothetical protein
MPHAQSPMSLTAAFGTYRHLAGLIDGSVTVPGVTFQPAEATDYVDIFRRMARTLEFDVALMSMISYLCAREYRIPFSALPVVVNAGFHHADLLVNVGQR